MTNKSDENWTWWKHGVIYHIYPLSFKDSNNDGYGDINGIIEKLDYLSDLGIDAIWLSPVYKSPMVDFGYDIANYKAIDPLFGTMENFIDLLKSAHDRNIKVIIDMVLNHTSNKHQWFRESRSSVDNPKRNWYIWKPPKKGKAPNNWKSAYGGSAWERDKITGQYYLHTFFKEQPDLNWRNKEMKKAFLKQIRFWLDMGVDGLRLDVINMIVKDKKFRNNPGLLTGLLKRKQWFTRNQSKSYKIIRQLRKMLDEYDDRMCIGEVYTLPPGDSELVGSYLNNGNDSMHLAFDFTLMFKPWNARKYYNAIEKWYSCIPQKGWPCNVFSNHDLRRSISKVGFGETKYKKAKVLAMLLLTLKGTPFIYYGEEIGMQNTRLKKSALRDPLGKKFWPLYSGRDKVRTPMQWNNDLYAGFSVAKPWLPVNNDYLKINVENQKDQEDSIFTFYKSLIRIKKEKKALHFGDWIPIVKGDKGVLIYFRIHHYQKLITILNFTRRNIRISLPSTLNCKVLLSTVLNRGEFFETSDLYIKPYEATLLEEII